MSFLQFSLSIVCVLVRLIVAAVFVRMAVSASWDCCSIVSKCSARLLSPSLLLKFSFGQFGNHMQLGNSLKSYAKLSVAVTVTKSIPV